MQILNKKRLYVISQAAGWLMYIIFAGIFSQLTGVPFERELIISLLSVYGIGLIISHVYREVIIRLGWIKLGIAKLIPRVIAAAIICGSTFHILYNATVYLLISSEFALSREEAVQSILIWSALFFIWSLIYFIFHFFQNYRQAEIENLKWEATKNTFELNRLKSQLNPHFIFNSMNTIRAQVDEEPQKAKKSITQLSNILRNSLMSGKKKEIDFEEEIDLVKDYLEIEKSRYEERLVVEWDIHPESTRFKVPPMMIQTLVENGIKHGVARLAKGGRIAINTNVIDDHLHIILRNSGQYRALQKSNSGFGILNTKQRLNLLYGKEGSFQIYNVNGSEVVTEVVIPNSQQTNNA